MSEHRPSRLARLSALLTALAFAANAQAPAQLRYYDLVPGFVAEKKNDVGFAVGYSAANRWGEYTAYLLTTNQGQRTWRIEQYQELPGAGFWQGSSMYLLEGARQALLIDTAQPSKNTVGTNDLKTVVRHLLGHDNDGRVRANPLDFVVANTHDHPDHIGENALMSDRTVYFMDGDWPKDAPPNYVPIREGGGATRNGDGRAVGEIDLGNRVLRAIALPPHTPGSTAYLDTANGMFFTGDALGSGWPWLHWATISEYSTALDHVVAITRGSPDLAVLPAHFYQIEAYGRRDGPLNVQYILDQQASARGIVNGSIDGEPYFLVGPTTYWGGTRSARLTYSLDRIHAPGAKDVAHYHAVRIPGPSWKREWIRDPAQAKLFDIKSDLHLIRTASGHSLFLLRGSRAALLIGTGMGEPGLAELVDRLAGNQRLMIATLSRDPSQVGGMRLLRSADRVSIERGTIIDLGLDASGRPLRIEAHSLTDASFALLSTSDRVLFVPDATSTRSVGGTWRSATQDRYDVVYSTASDHWFTPPSALEMKQ